MGANSLTYPTNVSGFLATLQDTITRPADTTAYASGDIVSTSTTAATVQASGFFEFTNAAFAGPVSTSNGGVRIEAVRIRKSGTSVTNASFRLHLWNARPATVNNGDNAAFSGAVSGVANYLGAFDITLDRVFTDGSAGRGLAVSGSPMSVTIHSSTTIFGLIEARGAYTPSSAETFTAVMEVYRFAA